MKSIFLSIVVVCALVVAGISGTLAVFSDAEEVGQNVFAAGTLDLQLIDGPVSVTIDNLAPGWEGGYRWTIKNVGSLPGTVSVEFSPITNLEGDVTGPELIAEAQDYWGSPLGRAEGELGEYLSTTGGYYYPGWVEFITSRETGPPVAGRVGALGLNALGGNIYDTGVTLGPGEEMGFGLVLVLRSDLRAWDNCAYHDWIDDNIIQGDSVEFSIIFHLEQTP